MNIFTELDIKPKNGSDDLIAKLREFCSQSTAWVYDEKKSYQYSKDLHDSKGCVIIYHDGKWTPGFALCEKKDSHFYLANIVPKKTGSIPIQEYNDLSRMFYRSIKDWSSKNRCGLRVTISKTDLELEDIISAKIPRKHFQSFLSNHPLSYHPCDVRRLNKFICAVSRYSRKQVNLEYLDEYLREKKRWPESNISWCINRIETGLQIIYEYKRFH